ncbi:hypothetical protein Tco_1322017 [Tanacetum coccineum]
MEETLRKFMAESAKRHDENSNLIKEIRASTDAAIKNQRASIKALVIQIEQIIKILQEKGSGGLSSSTKTNSRDHVKSITTTDEAEISSIRRIRPNRYDVSNKQKDNRLSLTEINQANIPFLGRLKEYSYDENEILKEFKKLQVSSNESATSIKRLLGEKWRIEEEIKAKMNEHYLTIIKDDLPPDKRDLWSFTLPCTINNMHFNKALADLGASLRNHVNEDLGPTINEGEVIDELNGEIVETRNDNVIVEKINEYHSLCDYDRKIKDNCSYNLRFSYMIGYEHVDANFFPILSINVMSKKNYNSIMKEKIEYKGNNLVGAFINVPIFIIDFSAIIDFAVVENMDNYRDEGMGLSLLENHFVRKCVSMQGDLMDSSPSTMVIVA